MTLVVDDDVLENTIRSLGTMKVPPILQDRISRHQQHLTDLASALLTGGQSKESVRQTIEIAMDSFKHELTATIEALIEGPDAC